MIRGTKSRTAFTATFLIISLGAFTQTPSHGIKILSVKSGSVAEKAGVKAGDFILEWSQDGASGTITSPLDFYAIEREYSPRGAVNFRGVRDGNSSAWTLNGRNWGIKPRATWPEAQPVLERLNQLDVEKKFSDMAEYCRLACPKLDEKTGARSYAYYFAATTLADARQMEPAVDFHKKALAAQSDRHSLAALQIYWAWGTAYRNIGDWAAASRVFEEGLKSAEERIPQSLTTAWMYQNLAEMKHREGKLQEASALLQRALALGKSIAPQSYLVGVTLNALAVLAENTDDLETNLKWLQEALPVAVALGDPEFTSLIYTNLGVNAIRQRDLVTAEKYLTQGLDVTTHSQVADNTASRLLATLGVVAVERYNLTRAENFFNRALSLNHNDDIFLGDILGNLANVKGSQGDTIAALKLFQRSLEVSERVQPKSLATAQNLTNYGLALKAHGDFKEAEEVSSRGVAIALGINPIGAEAAEGRKDLAGVYAAEGKLPQAQRELQSALPVLQRLERDSIPYAECLSSLADVEQRLGQTTSALTHYQLAMKALNAQSVYLGGADSVRFSSEFAEVGERFATLLVRRGDARQAVEVLDHSRARTLVRSLTEKSVDIRKGVPAPLLAQDRELEKKLAELADRRVTALTEEHGKGIAELERKIASTSADHELAEQRIRAASPRYAALTQRSLPSIQQIQESLEPGTAVLEYMAGKEHSYLFAVDRNRVTWFRLASSSELDTLASATYESWSRASHGPEIENAPRRLSEELLGSSWEFIQRHKRLIVIMEGKLQYVPFVALPIPKTAQILGSKFEVVHLPSASLLVAMRQHPTHRDDVVNSIAVLGDPVFTSDDPRLAGKSAPTANMLTASLKRDLPNTDSDETDMSLDEKDVRGLKLARLIHSREEAAAVASTTTSDKVFMALDFDANLPAALDSQITHSRIVHFATHGFYDPKNPTMSGLVFSLVGKNGRQQPGFLGLEQVYRSHYSADLVVLSACETALGEEASGEGLVGLTWGFIYAGARSVVSSLWQVNDASTAELMRIFYTGIGKEGLTPAEALRKAQMTLAQRPEWSAPYYWAGFVIEGEYAK